MGTLRTYGSQFWLSPPENVSCPLRFCGETELRALEHA